MSILPTELIRRILEDLVDNVKSLNPTYHQHLLALSLSSRLLRHEAQRVLFRSPTLHTGSSQYNKTIIFLDTIISHPDRLALYVKTFDIIFDAKFPSDSTHLIQKVSSALQVMHNLKALDVDDQFGTIPSLPSVLEGVHFKLTMFYWTANPDSGTHVANVETSFLQHQDEIVHLSIVSFIEEDALDAIATDICPRLRSLAAPYSLTELILPDKKHVTSLQWAPPLYRKRRAGSEDSDIDDFPDLDSFDPDSISNELANLKYLSYGVESDIYAPLFEDIAPYLKSLICLEVYREDVKVEALSQLPHLKILLLSTYPYELLPEQGELMTIATACQTLERIDLEDKDGNFLSYRCDHSTKPTQVYTVDLDESQRIVWDIHYDMFDV